VNRPQAVVSCSDQRNDPPSFQAVACNRLVLTTEANDDERWSDGVSDPSIAYRVGLGPPVFGLTSMHLAVVKGEEGDMRSATVYLREGIESVEAERHYCNLFKNCEPWLGSGVMFDISCLGMVGYNGCFHVKTLEWLRQDPCVSTLYIRSGSN
jgi:hypothetical protein